MLKVLIKQKAYILRQLAFSFIQVILVNWSVVCEAAEGYPVYFSKVAYEADHVLVVGRVKPHTMFDGEVQSGVIKMLLTGLGKEAGAHTYHQASIARASTS